MTNPVMAKLSLTMAMKTETMVMADEKTLGRVWLTSWRSVSVSLV